VVVVLPFETGETAGDVAFGGHLPDNLDRLSDVFRGLAVAGHTVEALDPGRDRRTGAEYDSATGEAVEVHGGHGGLEWVAGEGDLDTGSQLGSLGNSSAVPEAH
jgi:hypothetical protein